MVTLLVSTNLLCLSIEYYDEVSKVEGEEGEECKDVPVQTDFAVKVLQLSDLSVELGTSLLPSPKASMSGEEGNSYLVLLYLLYSQSPPATSHPLPVRGVVCPLQWLEEK